MSLQGRPYCWLLIIHTSCRIAARCCTFKKAEHLHTLLLASSPPRLCRDCGHQMSTECRAQVSRESKAEGRADVHPQAVHLHNFAFLSSKGHMHHLTDRYLLHLSKEMADLNVTNP